MQVVGEKEAVNVFSWDEAAAAEEEEEEAEVVIAKTTKRRGTFLDGCAS